MGPGRDPRGLSALFPARTLETLIRRESRRCSSTYRRGSEVCVLRIYRESIPSCLCLIKMSNICPVVAGVITPFSSRDAKIK